MDKQTCWIGRSMLFPLLVLHYFAFFSPVSSIFLFSNDKDDFAKLLNFRLTPPLSCKIPAIYVNAAFAIWIKHVVSHVRVFL